MSKFKLRHTTRTITGQSHVRPTKVSNRSIDGGKGLTEINGLQYVVVRIDGYWYLTGEYSY